MPGMLWVFNAASRIFEMSVSTKVESAEFGLLGTVGVSVVGEDCATSLVVEVGDVVLVVVEPVGAAWLDLFAGSRFLFAGLALCATTNVIAPAPTIAAIKRITTFRAEFLVMGFCCGLFFMGMGHHE